MGLDYLEHYGTPRHSGRYPWGSGKNPYQHTGIFMARMNDLKKQGLSEKEIASAMGMTMRQYRARKSNVKAEIRAADRAQALRLYEEHDGNVSAVAREMGKNESSVRKLLDDDLNERSQQSTKTAETLKKQISKDSYLDVGEGSNLGLGISTTKLDNAVAQLQDKGYEVHSIYVEQMGTGKKTTVKVLCPPGTSWSEAQNHTNRIHLINGYTADDGLTLRGIEPPKPISSKRVAVKYAEDHGIDKDGVVEVRRGVPDVSLGKANYAQVRISVDGTHYIKGMAMYGDDKDFPPGCDLLFNTNKHRGTPMMGEKGNTVLKNIKDDPENPFGATIKSGDKLVLCQKTYTGKDGKQHQSVLNVVNEEGDWSKWSKTLSSQFLSKQSESMASQQLGIARDRKRNELDEIESLTNPVVKKKLLDSYADDADSAAVKLKAAAFPRSAMHVLLPVPSIKSTEVYAPNYKNGEKVALVRYPHAGRFEIPELTVNNNNVSARKNIGAAQDAIGIHPDVAQKLSGADFDGDTVMVIPITRRSKVQSKESLKGLKDFDPKSYKIRPEDNIPETSAKNGFRKQREMGDVSNLITDMTLRGATDEELTRAVRHSMVVIDAEKHNLNWRQSAKDNGIAALKKKYQGGERRGASTLISKSKSTKYMTRRKELTNPKLMNEEQLKDWKEGRKVWEYKPDYYYKTNPKTGKLEKHEHKIESTKMYEARDAYELIDKNKMTQMEKIYADHANALKSYANEARRQSRSLVMPKVSSSAKVTYANEVASLNDKVKKAMAQKPLERQAQIIANNTVREAYRKNPNMDKDDYKKLKNQALDGARAHVGKKAYTIDVTPREWEAIQSHAVSSTTVKRILDSADMDQIRKYATPHESRTTVSDGMKSRIKAMVASGNYTQAEIAEQLGISASTVSKVARE